MREKAYKLLAIQENITNRSAKDLIDRGLVYSGGKKVVMARAEMPARTRFRVEEITKMHVIFEDDKIVAIDKPAFVTSEQIAKKRGEKLLHRLDKETSGVLLLVKDEDFRKIAIEAFKKQDVLKEYIAWVSGSIVEPLKIDKPILTIRKQNQAYSKISTDGRAALSEVEPLMIEGKLSKVKVKILTGRTHQIRVHLKSEGSPIIGDQFYGGKPHKRVLLHASKIALLGYSFESKEPKDFKL
ncbi:MAG: RluA family pseudouridine synthase [Epsilonproteobacteria bacterium]|nr:RluA family pseudouridine synthase [Campylobacterota bacterium]